MGQYHATQFVLLKCMEIAQQERVKIALQLVQYAQIWQYALLALVVHNFQPKIICVMVIVVQVYSINMKGPVMQLALLEPMLILLMLIAWLVMQYV